MTVSPHSVPPLRFVGALADESRGNSPSMSSIMTSHCRPIAPTSVREARTKRERHDRQTGKRQSCRFNKNATTASPIAKQRSIVGMRLSAARGADSVLKRQDCRFSVGTPRTARRGETSATVSSAPSPTRVEAILRQCPALLPDRVCPRPDLSPSRSKSFSCKLRQVSRVCDCIRRGNADAITKREDSTHSGRPVVHEAGPSRG